MEYLNRVLFLWLNAPAHAVSNVDVSTSATTTLSAVTRPWAIFRWPNLSGSGVPVRSQR